MKRTLQIDLEREVERLVERAQKRAARGFADGNLNRSRSYIVSCTHGFPELSVNLVYTRDVGHHSSGWMKNPEYERCLHLSISAMPPRVIVPGLQKADLNEKTVWLLLKAFFGEWAGTAWRESAKSDVGKRVGVEHWRLFCDENWRPFSPAKSVYSTELTERGWKSASQVFEETGREVVSVVDQS